MKKKLLKGACVLLVLCLGFSIAGCQKSDEDDKKKETFKPSEYTLQAKEEYVYEYLGLKFKLSDKIRKDISDKKIAMLDEQSPTDEELKYAVLTFSKMTKEQRNAVVDKMGDGYLKWEKELERIGTIGMFAKDTSEKEISKITKCDTHTKIGVSTDGNYEYYLSTNQGVGDSILKEFNKTEFAIIDKKERPENGFVLSEKTDLASTEAFGVESGGDLSNLATKDIDGKEFSGKDFADYDITMVNVFATWCTACVNEIPDLIEVQKEMKDKGVNIIGVVTDTVDDNGENKDAIKKAKTIQEKTKATYPFLMPEKTNFNGRLNGIQALPETFFVDKNGKIVGDTYSGARNAKEWKKVIERELENIKK